MHENAETNGTGVHENLETVESALNEMMDLNDTLNTTIHDAEQSINRMLGLFAGLIEEVQKTADAVLQKMTKLRNLRSRLSDEPIVLGIHHVMGPIGGYATV